MDSISSPGVPKSISEQDTDVVDFHRVVEVDPQESYPSRPANRLGFNGDQPPPAPSEGAGDSEVVQWSRSLFQSVGISNLQMSAIKTGPAVIELPAPIEAPVERRSLDHMAADSQSPSTGDTSLESPHRTPPEHFGKAPKSHSKSPSNSPRPVSRLCFPFVITPSSRRPKPPPAAQPPPRHKYSCFPSRMSPVPAGRPCPIRQRHNYAERGYSRLALQHTKWFWSLREDEWNRHHQDVDQAMAHNDTSPEKATRPPIIYPEPLRPCSPTPQHPPMTIHPRRGDIAALRDPYCVHIDYCFAGLATWTIGKALWMFDLHMAAEHARARSKIVQEEDVSDFESESEMDICDDSDATLVESESECEFAVPTSSSKRIAALKIKEFDYPEVGKCHLASTPQDRSLVVPDSNSALGEHDLKAQTALSSRVYLGAPPSRNTGYKISPWATNWYQRWDLLVDLTRQDRDRGRASFDPNQHLEWFTATNDSTEPHLSVTRPTNDLEMTNPWNDRIKNIDAQSNPLCHGLVT